MSKFNEQNEEYVIDNLSIVEAICPELIELIYPFTVIGIDYICVLSEFLSENLETFDYEKIDIDNTIKMVRNFLSTIDNKYVLEFDKCLVNGNFDIFSAYNLAEDPTRLPEPICIEMIEHTSINIPINYNIMDGAVIVHEFFHYTNSEYENGIRDIVTEIISCYMELRYYHFLIEKGYDITHYYKALYERINNTYNCASNIVLSGSILDIYFNTGDINKENIKFMNNFRKIYSGNKKYLLDFSRSDEFEDGIYGFQYDVAHLLGGIISINLLKETKVNDLKIKYINNNIENLSIKDILNMLEVDINNFKELIDYCANIIKSLEGVIYEEDNCNSRSNRSRKDKVKR